MNCFIFLIIFILIANWKQIIFFVVAFLRPKVKKTKLKNKWMLDIVKEKAGLNLKHIVVIESDKMYGGMSGIPGRPLMMLSSQLLKTLNKEEQEYVLLHEAAHFKYYHPIILAVSQIALILVGLYFVYRTPLCVAILAGFLLGLMFIQIARVTERAAENFAASHMENPKAMLSAVAKFNKRWKKSLYKPLKLISWNVSYEEKHRIAKKAGCRG